jgi:hypothetical protein
VVSFNVDFCIFLHPDFCCCRFRKSLISIHCLCKKFYTINKSQSITSFTCVL